MAAPAKMRIAASQIFNPGRTLRYMQLTNVDSKGIRYANDAIRIILPWCIAFSQNM